MPLSPENRALFRSAICTDFRFIARRLNEADLETLLNACRLEERAKAEGEVADILVMTGCRDRADLEDMANVGKSLLEAIGSVASHGRYKGWMPADGPAEIVTDLLNDLEEAESNLAKAEARIAELTQEGARPPYVFRRFYDGVERAEGVQINLATTLEEATLKAVRLCRERGTTVLVLKAASLQGEGSSSVSSAESAASLASELTDQDRPAPLDQAWAAVNVLGAPDTARRTDEDRAYCRGIGDALREIEKLGGKPW